MILATPARTQPGLVGPGKYAGGVADREGAALTGSRHGRFDETTIAAQSDLRGVLAIKPFRSLWLALAASSLGNWLGLLAITALAADLARGPAAASPPRTTPSAACCC